MGSGRGTALESIDHGVKVPLFGCLHGCMLGRIAVNSLMKDRVVRVMFLHSVQIIRAFEEVRALAAGVFGSH